VLQVSVQALDLLPARIAALEARITELNAALADPHLYRRDPARFRDITDALTVTRDELAAAEDQWLRLGDAAGRNRRDRAKGV
jgi:ATP-binding cassette subfamily F protein uup